MVNVRKAITCQSEVDIGKVKICNQFVVWNSRGRKFWLFNFLYLLHLGIVELHHIFLGFTVLLPILSSLPSVIFFYPFVLLWRPKPYCILISSLPSFYIHQLLLLLLLQLSIFLVFLFYFLVILPFFLFYNSDVFLGRWLLA